MADNLVIASGTSTGNGDITCPISPSFIAKAGQTYRITLIGTDTRNGTLYFFLGTAYKNIGNIPSNTHSIEFTPDTDITVDQVMMRNTNGNIADINAKVMMTEGSVVPTAFSPYSNICPISGHTGAEISGTGINIWDEEWESGDYNDSDGLPHAQSTRIRTKNPIPCKPSTSYYYVSTGIRAQFFYYDSNDNFISTTGWYEDRVITTPSNCHHMRFYLVGTTSYDSGVGINYPATDTEYHPYTGDQISVDWADEAGTVYGGTLDVVSGKLIVEYVKKTVTEFNGVLGTVPNGYCVYALFSDTTNLGVDAVFARSNIFTYFSGGRQGAPLFSYGVSNGGATTQAFILPSTVTSLAEANAWLANNPTECTFKLATPIEYTLTANELTTLYGTNNIWANTGDVSVTYIAKSAKFSFGSPLHTYNYTNLKLFGNTYIEHGKG